MAVKYVDDFSFSSDHGFTGSAGRTMVKGYSRGGKVAKAQGAVLQPTKAMLLKKYANARAAAPKREPLIQPPDAPMPGGSLVTMSMKRGGKVGC